MRAQAQAVLLIVVGVVVLRIALFGEFLNYVKPGHYPWLLLVGAAAVVFGVVGLVQQLRRPPSVVSDVSRKPIVWTHGPLAMDRAAITAAKQHEDEHRHGHDHSRAPWVAWLLYAPVIVMLLVPPPALGSYAAARGGAAVRKPTSTSFAPLPAGDPAPVKVSDYAVRATWDHGRTLAGRRVELTGFVTVTADGSWYLTRMLITCCAADALAYEVKIDGASRTYPANTWLTVVGTWTPSAQSDPSQAVAQLRASSVRVASQPRDTYEQ